MGLKVEHNGSDNRRGSSASRANVVLLGFLAIGGYFLVTEHWAHIVPFLPWLHGSHSGERNDVGDPADADRTSRISIE